MDVQLELESVAVHARLITVIVKTSVTNYFLVDIALKCFRLVGSSNCHEVGEACFDDIINAISNLRLSASIKFICKNSEFDVMIVDCLGSH
jgi:hypothetical protein